ncbi:hypothetical protein BH23BAC3_BH23BAC3_25540 [soil metagenome]
MEFEELKRIWDQQNDEPIYAINEDALHNRIRAKKNSAGQTTNFSELLLLFANIAAGFFILITNKGNIYLYLLAGLMLATAAFIIVGRVQRKRREKSFDRSMLGELNHGIATATYQVRLSLIMRWYALPVGILTALALWQSQTSIWISFLVLLFFGFAWFAGGWEHRIYINKKHELEMLRNKLAEEKNSTDPG